MTRTDVACQGRQIAVIFSGGAPAHPSGRAPHVELCVRVLNWDGWKGHLWECCLSGQPSSPQRTRFSSLTTISLTKSGHGFVLRDKGGNLAIWSLSSWLIDMERPWLLSWESRHSYKNKIEEFLAPRNSANNSLIVLKWCPPKLWKSL